MQNVLPCFFPGFIMGKDKTHRFLTTIDAVHAIPERRK